MSAEAIWEGLSPPYSTIVADPPWKYRKTDERPTSTRWAEWHYSTMTMHEIAALPVQEIAAENAHLYLWVTLPRLYGDRDDFTLNPAHVMAAWGFRYVTMLTWVKHGLGLGNYFRVSTEHVLFGVRGHAPIPRELRRSNVITAAHGAHSTKPPALLDLVEEVSPAPRIELFARQQRLGWDTWGMGHEFDRPARVLRDAWGA